MRWRLILASLAILAGVTSFTLNAQDPGVPKQDESAKIRDEISASEQQIARQFAEFEQALLKLAQRLKRSEKREDQERAKVLEKVLEESRNLSVSIQFEKMIAALNGQKLTNAGDVRELTEKSQKLADDLRLLLTKMREDPRAKQASDDRKLLAEMIKNLDKIIHQEKNLQARTELGKSDPRELKSNQGQVREKTNQLVKDLEKFMKKDDKGGEPKAPPKGESKGAGKGEGKPGESKGSEAKAGEPKEAGKPGEAKSGGKGESQAKGGKNSSGSPSDSPPSQAQAKEAPPQPPQPPQPNQGQKPNDEVANSKKRIQEGEYNMKRAEDNLEKKENPKAAEDQAKAIQELEKAKKDLEKLLRQLREEEMERMLAQLIARCEKMLVMQMQVLDGTIHTDKGILATADKKPAREHQQQSLKLSDQEKEIVIEANKAIEMLEAEGSAVAFPEVFQQVREDMKHVQRRLEVTDTREMTQNIERDIIDSLKEMIEALKKAKSELGKSESKGGPSGPPPDQKLLDKIAELKMIRSLQIRVNGRTEKYGKEYQEREGEQTANPIIRRELNNLAERQERIFEITNRIAKGDSP